MRTIKIGLFKKAKIYDSIKELTIERDHEFRKLLLQDLGVGSDMGAITKHFGALHAYLSNGKIPESLQEAKNLHNTFYYIIQGINIKSYCFAALVYEIGGKKVTDFSSEGIKETLNKISGMNIGQVEDILFDVKKNLIQNFEPLFLTSTRIQDY